MRTCPVGIEIILHMYYSPNPSPYEGTQAYDSCMKDFGLAGLVEWKVASGEWDAKWWLTNRGNAWVELICSTPYPEKREEWFDPRTNESISSM